MPRRRRTFSRGWRVTAVVVALAVAVVASSAVVNHEVNRRLATLPLVTTSSSVATTTTDVPRPTTPRPQRPPRVVVEAATQETTTTVAPVVVEDVPQSAYDIITKLDALPVRDEHTLGYTRYSYGAWRDDDGDGCTVRDDVLITQAIQVVSRTSPCRIDAGQWHSPYDDVMVTDPSNITVDHVVGLNEAWRSGAWNWTDAQRNDYLNDLKDVNLILAVSQASSRAKAGRDPKDWLPGNQSYRCRYLQTWVDVKTVWKLAVDAGEREAIASAALSC